MCEFLYKFLICIPYICLSRVYIYIYVYTQYVTNQSMYACMLYLYIYIYAPPLPIEHRERGVVCKLFECIQGVLGFSTISISISSSIRSPTRRRGLTRILNHRNRRFARNAPRGTEDETVENQITEQEHAAPAKIQTID